MMISEQYYCKEFNVPEPEVKYLRRVIRITAVAYPQPLKTLE